ncbi:MAG: hypothetical protein ABSB88_16900 [Bryobacteraceae bacterium]|jgi:hypothetical protein
MRYWVILLAVLAAIPACADTRFRAKKMTRNDVPLGKGQCDIRLQVDGQVDVAVRGDMVVIHAISGQDARDDGSECNSPLPGHEPRGFNFQVVESRNEIRLAEPPSRRNDFGAMVQIRDSSRGFGRYHFRLSWETGPVSELRRDEPDRRDERFIWNNALNFRGRGMGEVRINGNGPRRLQDATVEVDRGGKIVVSFRSEGPRPVVFTGTVMGREEGRLKADVMTEDGRLHGPMYLSVDDRQNVTSITLDATDGQDRLHLGWDKR